MTLRAINSGKVHAGSLLNGRIHISSVVQLKKLKRYLVSIDVGTISIGRVIVERIEKGCEEVIRQCKL